MQFAKCELSGRVSSMGQILIIQSLFLICYNKTGIHMYRMITCGGGVSQVLVQSLLSSISFDYCDPQTKILPYHDLESMYHLSWSTEKLIWKLYTLAGLYTYKIIELVRIRICYSQCEVMEFSVFKGGNKSVHECNLGH